MGGWMGEKGALLGLVVKLLELSLDGVLVKGTPSGKLGRDLGGVGVGGGRHDGEGGLRERWFEEAEKVERGCEGRKERDGEGQSRV